MSYPIDSFLSIKNIRELVKLSSFVACSPVKRIEHQMSCMILIYLKAVPTVSVTP